MGAVVNHLSDVKDEPDWMREFRLEAYSIFKDKPDLDWEATSLNWTIMISTTMSKLQTEKKRAGMMYRTILKIRSIVWVSLKPNKSFYPVLVLNMILKLSTTV